MSSPLRLVPIANDCLMNKTRVGVAVVLLVVVMALYWAFTGTTSERRDDLQNPVISSSVAQPKPSLDTVPAVASEITESAAEDDAISAPSGTPILMQPATLESVRSKFNHLSDQRLSDGRRFIRFNTPALTTLEVGEAFRIPLIHSELIYTGTVDKITEFEGIKRFTGSFAELAGNQINRFSMTISSDGQYVAANFATDTEAFTLEAIDGLGWINGLSNETRFLHESEGAHQTIKPEQN